MLSGRYNIITMNKLSTEKRSQILQALCDGMSIRGTARLTGVAINSVVKLLKDAGNTCLDYQDQNLVDLSCKRVQCDEIWSFVYSKQKNVPEDRKGQLGYGDVWTWVAIDADTKLVPCWQVGDRSADTASEFMHNLAGRLNGRVQLTTDGYRVYLEAVEGAFGCEIDYAMLQKTYGGETGSKQERKYSPGKMRNATKLRVQGNPDKREVSTSFVERQNLTMRMSMRRFTRLTNAFSKKLENHMHAISLYYMYYNFCRKHQSLGMTPAMAAGIADHVWEISEVVKLVDSK